jgi:hydroxymethylbilane synthase
MGATRLGIRSGGAALTEAGLVAKRLGAEVVVLDTAEPAGVLPALSGDDVDAVLLPATAFFDTGATLSLAAVAKRRDARDAFVGPSTLAALAEGARVAVDTELRRAEVRERRPDVVVELHADPESAGLDGYIIALAALEDPEDATELFQLDAWPTSPGQGGLVVVTRRGREKAVAEVDHRSSRLAVLAELGVRDNVGSDLAHALGAHALFDDGLLFLSARLYRPGGGHVTSSHALYPEDSRDPAGELAKRVADELVQLLGEGPA